MGSNQGLTSEELAAGQQVGAAGVAAASTASSPEEGREAAAGAIRAEAAKQKLELSDQDVTRLATAIVDAIDQRGGFDQPPPAVAVPTQAPAPAEGQPVAAAGEQVPQAPRKQSWAERHFRS